MPRTRRTCLVALCALAAGSTAAAAAPLVFHLDPERSTVRFQLDATMHDVHGTLGPASGDVRFDPDGAAAAHGEVVIDVTRADTGIGRRDRKMHQLILETDRYPTATYRIDRIDLPGGLRQGRNDLQLHGDLTFHGARHRVAVLTVARVEGNRVEATASFDVPYVEWGLRDPSFFVLRVGKTVRVELDVAGLLEGTIPPAADAATAAP